MAKKEFTYRGKTVEELKQMDLKSFSELLPARLRRTYKRGFTEAEQHFLEKLQRKSGKAVETHCRDMLVLPLMFGRIIKIHSGKEFVPVTIEPDMVGHVLGEFVLTRRRVAHNAPGIGATKS